MNLRIFVPCTNGEGCGFGIVTGRHAIIHNTWNASNVCRLHMTSSVQPSDSETIAGVAVCATTDIPVNSEVAISYGTHANEVLLLDYGFVDTASTRPVRLYVTPWLLAVAGEAYDRLRLQRGHQVNNPPLSWYKR